MNKLKTVISVLMALCFVLPLLAMPAFAGEYKAGDVIATLDQMFERDANADDSILIKPVTLLMDFGTVKALEKFDGNGYSSRYSQVAFQKAGVNGLPYAGTNFASPNQCGGVMITAPTAGAYRLVAHFNRKDKSTDGSVFTKSWVYAYVNNTDKDYIYNEKFWHTENGVTCDVTFNMDAGDKLYVFSDPNGGENAWWEDFCYFMDLKLTLKSTEKTKETGKTWHKGDVIGTIDTVFDRDMTYEGSLMVPVAKYIAFNNAIKPMKYSTVNNCYAGSNNSLFKSGTNGEPYAGTNFGEANVALGFKFTAPCEADYILKGQFNRKHDSTDESVFTKSWIYAYVEGKESKPVFSEKFWKTSKGVTCNKTVHLKKGQALYIFSDPNGGDNAWWEDCCYIMELSLTVGDVKEETGKQTETEPPVTTEPITAEPIDTEPVTTEPIDTEPVTTEPITTEPVTTEPVTTGSVTTASDTDTDGTTTAAGTDTGAVTTDKAGGEAEDKGGSILLPVIIGVAVLAAAAVTAALLIRKKKS